MRRDAKDLVNIISVWLGRSDDSFSDGLQALIILWMKGNNIK